MPTSRWFNRLRYSVHTIPHVAENGTRRRRGTTPKLKHCSAGQIFQFASSAGTYTWY